jgi:hypothetical protein
MKRALVGLVAALLVSTPAFAVQHVVTLNGTVAGEGADARYEFAGDFLQTHYGLTTAVGNGPNGPSYLPPLERAVAEVRSPNAGRTRGFHRTAANTGIPVSDGGTGVFQALTNVPSLPRTAGQGTLSSEVSRAWVDAQVIGFVLSRTGTTVTYSMVNGTVGQPNDVWSFTAASVADINALQFRIRSAGSNIVSLSNAVLTQGSTITNLGCSAPGICGTGLTGAFSAAAGDTHISLFDKINGDFSLSGNWTFDLVGGRAGNNAQIKLLSVPVISGPNVGGIPEPSSWAMLIAGFGLIGATLRRRRAVAA